MTDIYMELGVTRRHMNYLLTGESNASPDLARRIEKKTGIDKVVFVFGSSRQRRVEWKRYLKSLEAEAKP